MLAFARPSPLVFRPSLLAFRPSPRSLGLGKLSQSVEGKQARILDDAAVDDIVTSAFDWRSMEAEAVITKDAFYFYCSQNPNAAAWMAQFDASEELLKKDAETEAAQVLLDPELLQVKKGR